MPLPLNPPHGPTRAPRRRAQVWYSDDHGVSYRLSGEVFDHMDECTLAELDDGTVYVTTCDP